MKKNLSSHSLFLQSIRVSSFFLFLFFCSLHSHGQSRQSLEKEKKAALKKIQETSKILAETKEKKNVTIGQLKVIKQQIRQRETLISNISAEVSHLDEDLKDLQDIVTAMEHDLVNLKKEYASMVYAGYKASHSAYDEMVFIFAAHSFDQLIMRIKYLQHYSDYRQDQLEHINRIQASMLKQYTKMTNIKIKKESLLNEKVVENSNLIVLRDTRDMVVKELSYKEKNLKKELEENKRSISKLDHLIADMVRREIERSRKEAAAAEAKKNKTNRPASDDKDIPVNKVVLTPETQQISNNFAANKGRLIWLVQKGFISQPFGTHPHPVLKHVTVDNLGVDIQTNQNEQVRTVFEGKVTAVASVPGMHNVVMVQHGDYFTVYAKLKSVLVTTGQKVKAKDLIGVSNTDKNDVTEIQFQIWKNSEKQDPEIWLFKK
jgi:murein hydrolase activator